MADQRVHSGSSLVQVQIPPPPPVPQQQPNFAPKKCWICLNVISLNDVENARLREKFFLIHCSPLSVGTPKEKMNFIKLEEFTNRYILAMCRCQKKLAHTSCFNNYIDLKQSGNINMDIFCAQCNYKYLFNYPYNGRILKLFDAIDQFNGIGSAMMTGFIFVSSVYWCSLSYGALTVMQIYGYRDGLNLIKNSNLFVLSVGLPMIPLILVAGRYFSWQKLVVKLFPSYLKLQTDNPKRKFIRNNSMTTENQSEDEVDKNDAKILYNIRLIIGGLMLPTIATSIDYVCLSRVGFIKSVLLRTTIAGLAYTFIKGVVKIAYKQKVIWQQTTREILNYKHQ